MPGWGVLGGYLRGEKKDLGDQSYCLETFGQRDALVRRPERSEEKLILPKPLALVSCDSNPNPLSIEYSRA